MAEVASVLNTHFLPVHTFFGRHRCNRLQYGWFSHWDRKFNQRWGVTRQNAANPRGRRCALAGRRWRTAASPLFSHTSVGSGSVAA